MPRYHEILSYTEMVSREGLALQKGMNFRVRGGAAGYSIILMSVRKGAPYQDQWHETGPHAGMLEYEGHDAPRGRCQTEGGAECWRWTQSPSRLKAKAKGDGTVRNDAHTPSLR